MFCQLISFAGSVLVLDPFCSGSKGHHIPCVGFTSLFQARRETRRSGRESPLFSFLSPAPARLSRSLEQTTVLR